MTKKYCFVNCLKEILQMNYYRNHEAVSGSVHNISKHEDAIMDLFMKYEFKELKQEQKISKKQIKSWIENPQLSYINVGEFICQPFGKNNNPDFIIRVDHNCIVPVEAKSCKEPNPLYNSGGISKNYLYIFSCEKYNQTTIYWGKDIITEEQHKAYEARREKC